jgi:uncharacterized membrane protein
VPIPSPRPGTAIAGFAPAARGVLAASLLFLGLLHVIFGEQLLRMLPVFPSEPPGRPFWARALGLAIAIAAGSVLARHRRPHTAAVWLGALLLLPVLVLHVPRSIPGGSLGGEWLNLFKWLAMATAPFVLAALVPAVGDRPWRDRAIVFFTALAPWVMAMFMIDAAYAHVRFAELVSRLIPPFLPWPVFWTYFAAAPLAAGGLGLAIPRTRRLAALLTSLMIFLWFLLVHVPHMFADPTGSVGWSEMAEALAFSAFAFLLAAPLPASKQHRSRS